MEFIDVPRNNNGIGGWWLRFPGVHPSRENVHLLPLIRLHFVLILCIMRHRSQYALIYSISKKIEKNLGNFSQHNQLMLASIIETMSISSNTEKTSNHSL